MTLLDLATDWRDMAPHTATLTRLAADAQSIVELGVRGGVSTWALLDGLPYEGRMTSVDIEDVVPDLPERITTDPRWTFVCGDDLDPAVQGRLPRADLVFIDTTHTYDQTKAELLLAQRLGAARIALHDWNVPDVERAVWRHVACGPYRLWLLEPSAWGLAVLAR